ncbi:MAG TPA: TonB-dependent receptor [Pyrinomonadaceae bacterium]|jgi:iron complex outermembrane receptor protein|nr:TonB-dependent receptor [Pyrinomonadaceae bacterium]
MQILRILTLIVLATVGGFAQSRATITGKVTGCSEALGNATVVLSPASKPDAKLFAKADDKGTYTFKEIEAGEYTVSVQNTKFIVTDVYTPKLIVGPGERKELDVVLVLSCPGTMIEPSLPSPPIHEYVTVAAGENQTVEQVSKTVDAIDAQQMRDRADFTLAETLRTIPGFRVQQLGGFGKTANIKTRGLRNQDTALLIDGIRFRDPSAINGDASPFISDFTLTSVSKIEVLRGSGSSLYGTNAIGGVVDFQTPEAKSGTHGQIGGAVGGLGLGRFRGLISHGTRNGKFGINAGVSRTVYTKGIDGDDDAHNTNLQARVDGKLGLKTTVSGRMFFSDANVRLNGGPDTKGPLPASNATIINAQLNVNFTPDVNDPDAIQRSRFFSGQFVVNQIINDKLFFNGYYQGLKTRRTNVDGPLGPGFQPFETSTSFFDGQIHTLNGHLVYSPNRVNTFTAGYEFELEKFGNRGLTPSAIGNFTTDAGQRSHTVYVQHLVSLDEGRLQLAGGFRAQRFSLRKPMFSLTNAPYSNLTLSDPPTAYTFDGAVSYFFRSSGTKLRGHVGNGYRVPSLYERFGTFYSTFGTPSFVPLGDPTLKPERSIAFDAGIEQNAAKDKVRLSATYFYTRLTDIIGFGSLPQPDPFGRLNFLSGGGYQNQKGGIARGGEFSVKAAPSSRADIFASYTFTNSDQRTPQVAFSGVTRTLGVPDHQFTFVATQRFGHAWVNFDFLATSTYLAPIFSNATFTTYIYRFTGNRTCDLTGGYTFSLRNDRSFRIYGTIENLFNQAYYENGFRTAKATARVGATFGF